MPATKTVLKSVTPGSVKVLMIVEAIAIAFFSFWIANEYTYNAYFRGYVSDAFLAHLTTFTIALGLGIGLAGTAVAATLLKTMREAKVKLETVAPKIKGSVEKILSGIPVVEAKPTVSQTGPSAQAAMEHTTTAIVPVALAPTLQSNERKK